MVECIMSILFDKFVSDANKLFDGRYRYYSYKNKCDPIRITCPEHGDYYLPPVSHLRGIECPPCTERKKNEDFIRKATEKHRGRYSYPNTVYVKSQLPVLIVCSEHGEFPQRPTSHLMGKGCPTCAGHRHNTESFIIRAKEVHGDTYDYSLVVYEKRDNKVKIICPHHGVFLQATREHIDGNGCQKCGRKRITESKIKSFDEMVKEANLLYDGKYTYDESTYVSTNRKMRIHCPIHGYFLQAPSAHIFARKRSSKHEGCPSCSIKPSRISFEAFVRRSREIHGDTYEYIESTYRTLGRKLDIICKKHGVFSQSASNHINTAAGCPKCTSHISKPEVEWLDSLGIPNDKEHRQVYIKLENARGIRVDGFDPVTNTVYEFDGDFWHGNPERYCQTDIHPVSKKTFGQLFERTQTKKRKLEAAGYRVISIWESDWSKC